MTTLDRWTLAPCAPGRLYEGPRWIAEAGVFQWVDILGASIHRWDPYSSDTVDSRPLDLEFASVALPLDDDRSVVASRSSLHEYVWSTNTLRTSASWKFAPDVRFNDGAVAPDGALYVGTMSMERKPSSGGLFRIDNSTLVPVVQGIGISNGLAWTSPTRGFYVDSLVPRLHVLDLDQPEPLSTFVDLGPDDEPDGIAVTPEGDVLVALWEGAAVARFGPGGDRRGDYAVPARYPTAVAVGGRDEELLLVTTGAATVGDPPMPADGAVLLTRR